MPPFVAQFEKLSRALSDARPEEGSGEGVEATVGVLLVEGREGLEVLLVQRAERESDPWSGHIGLPGGRVKSSDSSILEACRREVLEEVGVEVTGDELLGSLSPTYPSNRPELKVQPWVFGLVGRPSVEIGPEIVEAFWVPLSKLRSLGSRSEVSTRSGRRTVDSFVVDGKIVWGFTFRVLDELLRLAEESS